MVVFGNDFNYLVMFNPQWMSIAMCNDCDELKAKADFITDRNVNDGIWNVYHHFG